MSNAIRYISDPHFGHRNMAAHRGFSSVEEHDEHIIESWNSVVRKKDTTLILGDVTMEKANYDILDRLNGFKRVILGNHDKGNHVRKMLEYVNSVHALKYTSFKKQRIALTHCPIHPSEFDSRVKFNIHGHIHEKDIMEETPHLSYIDPRYINVCCERINYIPKTLEELLKGKI